VTRIAIFIDGGYLDHVLKEEFGSRRISYSRFSTVIAGGKEILRTYYYTCPPFQSDPPSQEERERTARALSFYSSLESLPRFEVKLGHLSRHFSPTGGSAVFEQKQVDMLLGVDLVLLAAKHLIGDAAVVTGDSDFLPAIRIAKNEGVVVHLWHGGIRPGKPAFRPHNELFAECDERHRLTPEIIDEISLK